MADANRELVPVENTSLFALFYVIEVGLREFTIARLGSLFGPRWWKTRLPPDVLVKYRDGVEYERGIRWSELIPHHPLYYIDFPALRKTIERSDNWRDAFAEHFGDPTVFAGTMRELEPIRNKLAHNRKATMGDVTIVEAAHAKLQAAIGTSALHALVTKVTAASDIPGRLRLLRSEARSAAQSCRSCEPPISLPEWSNTDSAWWFDDDYLGVPLPPLRDFFEHMIAYADIPRTRGSGPAIEKWVHDLSLETHFQDAETVFNLLLGGD